MNFKTGILLTFFLFLKTGGSAQELQIPSVSILTCAPGSEIYSIYGHNAIRVKYDDRNDLVFNYGTFDFNTPNFTLKFLRGKLPYQLSVNHFQDFLYEYNVTKRSVVEQVLNLDSIQTDRMVKFLENNVRPENRQYKYDFFYDNCATRIYDVLQHATGNEIVWQQEKKISYTFRDIIKLYQKGFVWTDFGIDLIIGAGADKETDIKEEMFIPDFVQYHLSKSSLQGKKFVAASHKILSFERPEYSSIHLFFQGPLFFFLFVLSLEFLIFSKIIIQKKTISWLKKYDNICFFTLSVLSLAMIFMWFFTDHVPTKDNWNLLWTLPAMLYFIPKVKGNTILLCIIGMSLTLTIANAFQTSLLPQYFNPIFGIIGTISLLKWVRLHLVFRRIGLNEIKKTS